MARRNVEWCMFSLWFPTVVKTDQGRGARAGCLVVRPIKTRARHLDKEGFGLTYDIWRPWARFLRWVTFEKQQPRRKIPHRSHRTSSEILTSGTKRNISTKRSNGVPLCGWNLRRHCIQGVGVPTVTGRGKKRGQGLTDEIHPKTVVNIPWRRGPDFRADGKSKFGSMHRACERGGAGGVSCNVHIVQAICCCWYGGRVWWARWFYLAHDMHFPYHHPYMPY